MSVYPCRCSSCGHEGDITVSWRVYEKNDGIFSCPKCQGAFCRTWSGRFAAPYIKTVTRIEDVWKKNGTIDPEDPSYAKLSRERVMAMREKTKKKKERLLEQGMAKKRRVNIKSDDNKEFTKADFDKLPKSARSSYHVQNDGKITEE